MKFRNRAFCAAIAVACLPGTLWAANTVLSGVFDGSEARIAPLPGTCPGAGALGYRAVSNVQVTASGSYTLVDAFNLHAGDVTALVYSGSFNPNAPQNNLLRPGGIDEWGEVALSSGTNYMLVVQHWCENREGAWAVTFSGPGSVNTSAAVAVPDLTEGDFAAADPTADTVCGDSQYPELGLVQVARSGSYYYADISLYHAVDMCLQIYTAPFNPASPSANLIAAMDDFGTVELEAGEDYYFVVQPLDEPNEGEFFFVFAPPAPFRITHAIAGAWYEPATAGQGFLMDVFDNANSMFLAWFTYDIERPGSGAEAMIGDLGTAGVQGQVPIQRLANDAVELCQSLYAGPDRPGPL